MKFPLVLPAFVIVLGLGQAASAETAAAPSLADLGHDKALATAVKTMAGDRKLPDWLAKDATTTPGQQVAFGGQTYTAMTACKAHDCAAEQVAVLYGKTGVAYGVISTSDDKGNQQLTWLNIGGGPESIDGRTILFAALTGSLDNHPKAFSFAGD